MWRRFAAISALLKVLAAVSWMIGSSEIARKLIGIDVGPISILSMYYVQYYYKDDRLYPFRALSVTLVAIFSSDSKNSL